MRVLIFHGYLLRGTGSNVYNASLARALARLGHDVHLLCQDRSAAELDWVGSVGRWQGDRLQVERLHEPATEGSVTVYLPEIGDLLPVYVADRYEGFRVKTFPELSDGELNRYLEANMGAVRDVLETAGEPRAALANHLIMGPTILARAGLGFAAKVHGSDLSYTVLPHLERFRPFAEEGIESAAGILVGSRHIADRLRAAVGSTADSRIRLGPPGVDSDLFSPLPDQEAELKLEALVTELRRAGGEAAQKVARGGRSREAGLTGRKSQRAAPPRRTAWDRDPEQAAAAIEHWAACSSRVVFVGKLIVAKGVDLLLAAWPLVVREHPGARLLLVGFGAYREGLERLWAALSAGDLVDARDVAARGRALEGGSAEPLAILSAFLGSPPNGYEQAARGAGSSVSFSGRLEHDEVAELLPAADVLVMPSTFPEAFGMVAAEAAACGVLPVSADHSGMREVSRQLADPLDSELRPLLSFRLGSGAVEGIAERVDGWLSLGVAERREAGRRLAARVEELWSWEGVARGVIAASQGDLERLPAVPEE